MSRYSKIIELVFFWNYQKGDSVVHFDREDLIKAAAELKLNVPKNVGDIVYSFRYRKSLPLKISERAPKGQQWIISGLGIGKYAFRLTRESKIEPDRSLIQIKIPDATPEIVNAYALSDEQALLAKLRYNKLIDLFLRISAYSLQSHLRTTVKGVGQVEIDEIYVGVSQNGSQYIIPVQAKGGNDSLSIVQSQQDYECCIQKFPRLHCRAVSAQFLEDEVIALFELQAQDGDLRKVQERHYRLVASDAISEEDLKTYSEL
jgi:hypothetical protein